MKKRFKPRYPAGSPEGMIFAKVKRELAKAKRLESDAAQATAIAQAARASADSMVAALKKLDPNFAPEHIG